MAFAGGGQAGFSQEFPQLRQIATTINTAAPPIFRDAIMPHTFRGVCSNCHTIKPDVPITRDAVLPHKYRGVCSNCHTISGMRAGVQ